MSHTPGPWFIDSMGDGSMVCSKNATPAPDAPGLRRIDIVARTDWGRGAEDEANARLIAAAPDLLAALDECCTWIETCDASSTGSSTLERAYAAIDKAKRSTAAGEKE